MISRPHPRPSPRSESPDPARPWVRLNLAITADGKIATSNRAVSSFGSSHDLARLYRLRSQADAILCGAGTVNAEDADLGPSPAERSNPGMDHSRMPLRVVISGRGMVNPDGQLFHRRFGPIIVLVTRRAPTSRLHRLRSLAHTVHVCGQAEVDFVKALRWLRKKWNVESLLCEGGTQVNAALLEKDLVDEINLTICPWIVGGRDAPTIADGPVQKSLREATLWRLVRSRPLHGENFLTYQRLRAPPRRPC